MMVMGQFGFKLALVIHIIGALLLFGAFAAEAYGLLALRRARSLGQIHFSLGVSRRLPMIFHLSAGMILASGIYMGYQDWSHHEAVGWVIVALVLFLILGHYGARAGRQVAAYVDDALKASGGKMTTEVKWAACRPEPIRQLSFGVFSVIGILVLMVFQPSVAASVLILLLAIIFSMIFAQFLVAGPKTVKASDFPDEALPDFEEPTDTV